jgi:hypothetical protein
MRAKGAPVDLLVDLAVDLWESTVAPVAQESFQIRGLA